MVSIGVASCSTMDTKDRQNSARLLIGALRLESCDQRRAYRSTARWLLTTTPA
jgi:hypothetical protein